MFLDSRPVIGRVPHNFLVHWLKRAYLSNRHNYIFAFNDNGINLISCCRKMKKSLGLCLFVSSLSLTINTGAGTDPLLLEYSVDYYDLYYGYYEDYNSGTGR